MESTEKGIERYLVECARRLNGMARKWVCLGWDGAPDRIVLLPGGKIFFVELKRPGAKPRKLQLKRAEELRELGFTVYCGVSSKAEIDEILRKGIKS